MAFHDATDLLKENISIWRYGLRFGKKVLSYFFPLGTVLSFEEHRRYGSFLSLKASTDINLQISTPFVAEVDINSPGFSSHLLSNIFWI